MYVSMRTLFSWAVSAAILVGCSPAGPGRQADGGAGSAQPKRVVAALANDPATFNTEIVRGSGSNWAGVEELDELVNSGLGNVNSEGVIRAQLAEAVPTLENGLWQVFPDGRMETTWTIRPDTRWHDGTPFTVDDLLFTAAVAQDRDIAVFGRAPQFRAIESLQPVDARTLTIRWKQISIDADQMFSIVNTLPMPRHLLEEAFLTNKAGFTQLPYWSEDYVGTGPFKLVDWVRDSHILLRANDQYVLGRPKVDEILVRFIPDTNTIIANILAGVAEMTLGRGLSLEQAVIARDQWREGGIDSSMTLWIVIHPQHLSPNPAIIGDPRFRRALMHAIDRREMAETIQMGLVPVAHAMVIPGREAYRDIEQRVPRYDYDPARAQQMIRDLGFVLGPDGFVDSAGRRLSIEVRSSSLGLEVNLKSMLSVAEYWKRIGLAVEPFVLNQSQRDDREFRATFPGFDVYRGPVDTRGLAALHSSRVSLSENRFLSSGNQGRYVSPAFDALIEKHSMTIPIRERVDLIGQMVYRVADELLAMGLFYDADGVLIGNRLVNVTAKKPSEGSQAWNSEQWDIRN